jgi:DNA modification methylase
VPAEIPAWRVELGDCLDVLERMPAESVDAVVTDPPYGLEFMGEEWDRPWAVGFRSLGHEGAEDRAPLPQHGSGRNPVCRSCHRHKRGANRCACDVPDFDESPADAMRAFQAWSERWASACLRVLKPGGHLLAFGGTRTAHRLACAVEDAGFEIRDRVLTLNGHVLGPEVEWLYGSGWPKSRDISKAIDKRAGAVREVVGSKVGQPGYSLAPSQGAGVAYGEGIGGSGDPEAESAITAPATPEAEQWDGWGTALKPAHEPIVVARKPFRGTVEEQVLATGTGAVHIDACRIDTGGEEVTAGLSDPANRRGVVGLTLQAPSDKERNQAAQRASLERANLLGRWPANVALVHAAYCDDTGCAPGCPVAELDELSGELSSGDPTALGDRAARAPQNTYCPESRAPGTPIVGYGDQGGASRFFYSAKASPAEREFGLDGLPEDLGGGHLAQANGTRMGRDADEGAGVRARPRVRNTHPTVKPLALMRWLVRLVTPPDGVVLDPFTGSGSTGCAAVLEGVAFVGVERDERFAAIARRRIAAWAELPPGTDPERVLAVENDRRRSLEDAEERRRALASAGQLDLLASGGG